jgi:hypothetical protein
MVSVDSNTVRADFIVNGKLVPIDNFTTYSLESDFFVACDSFHLTIEDDRAEQLNKQIQVGSPIVISVDNHAQLAGYVDKITLSYSRGGGSTLSISGRDYLGAMSDATCNPNLKYTSQQTIKSILEDLFDIFALTPTISNAAQLTVATGGYVGTATHSKSAKGAAKSWARKINRQIKPAKEEGYLEYAMRLSKEVGLNIKMMPGTTFVSVNTPTYDRDTGPDFFLTNKAANDVFVDKATNNIIDGSMSADWQKQPSCIISELAGGSSNPTYRRDIPKIIQVNEIVAFKTDVQHEDVGIKDKWITHLQDDIKSIIIDGLGPDSKLEPLNGGLMFSLPTLLQNQPYVGNVCRPMFSFDSEGSSAEELEFFAMSKMAKHQNEFLNLEYTVKDHKNNGKIWNVDTMTVINDTRLQVFGIFWLQKRIFSKSRSGGTITKLQFRLPYVYNFYATE